MNIRRNIEKLEVANYLLGMLMNSVKEGIKSQSKEEPEVIRARLKECGKKSMGKKLLVLINALLLI